MSKVVDTPQLIAFAEKAEKNSYNRCLNSAKLREELHPEGKHVISSGFLVGPDRALVIRAQIMMLMKNADNPVRKGMLDFDIGDYNNLPNYVVT
jgi:hypothetical protein